MRFHSVSSSSQKSVCHPGFQGGLEGSITFSERKPLQKVSLWALRFRYAPVLLRQAADLHLCYDRVIMRVVNKHVCVCMCAVTAMSSIQ